MKKVAAIKRTIPLLNKLLFPCLLLIASANLWAAQEASQRWSEEKARAWHQKTGWLVGCNFLPSTAINQLEMFQADTFDLATIDRELSWAQSIGFNSIRVYLQDQLWQQDSQGLLKRLDQFLGVADKHGIGVVFVLFDSCWDPFPKLGTQRAPKPHLHNSGWVQSPGAEILLNPDKHSALKDYVVGVVGHFRNDRRVHAWDVWNEPDNINRPAYVDKEPANKVDLVLPLLKKAFAWAREANPSQPLTSGVWIGTWPDPDKLSPTEQVQLSQSDVISFHNYNDLVSLKEAVRHLKRYNRPLLCTEYMSRGNGSFFDPHLGYMKSQGVSAFNWGLVDGKSQTIYPWDSWTKQYNGEPPLWFHDIFRRDGKPYRLEEMAYIKDVTQSEYLLNGEDFTGWKQPCGDWQIAEAVSLDSTKPESFTIAPGQGLIVNGAKGRTVDLITAAEFGDIELHVEFCIPKQSNSGVYLQGRYEVQVYDSFGKKADYPGVECGGIYPRWINEQNVEGHSPRVDASKPPGQWQSFDIVFRAPRFDASGKKVANARMVRVLHNGQLVHENVDLKGPTRSAHWDDEKPQGPLLFQGDHGPVAYRNVRVKKLQLN
ncbi:MAG TPA: family 16 glycoside hydrolase [Clostridia bacterium]|nr:family 16 glycoside hydrolase [Clostridia bacterium]